MAYKPYRRNGIDIRFAVTDNNEKHLVIADVSKILGLGRPENVAKALSPGSCYKAKVEFPGIHPQTMWVLTPAGLQELLGKLDSNRIRGFQSWAKERKLLPDDKLTMIDAITSTDHTTESSQNESLLQQFIQWLKTCPIDITEVI